MLNLTAIEQRANAATPGPWQGYSYNVHSDTGVPIALMMANPGVPWGENQAFIYNARSDIPTLIARVRELEAALQLIADNNDETCIGDYVVHPVAPKGYGVWKDRVIDTALSSHDTFEAAIHAAKGLADGK